MTGKQEYRKFLQSDFWKELTKRKKELVGKCERCKKRKNLQSHHRFYRDDWYETQLDDLEVLCRRCHRKAHGFFTYAFMLHRDDPVFSAFVHRCSCLIAKIFEGRGKLRPRDERFLDYAERTYPPTKGDSCMSFKVNLVRNFNAKYDIYWPAHE